MLWIFFGILIMAALIWTFSTLNQNQKPVGTGIRNNIGSVGAVPRTPSLMGNSGSVPIFTSASTTGTLGEPERMKGTQCRSTCRNQCGGVRPLVRLTRRQKDKGACWDNCKQSFCRWVSDSELND